MTFRLALAGQLPDDPKIFRYIDEQIGQLKAHLYTRQNPITIQALVAASYTGPVWSDRLALADFPVCGYTQGTDDFWDSRCSRIIQEDTPLRTVLGEELCDRADLLMVVWNEDVTELNGATWELIQLAHHRGTPCLWISSRSAQSYWSQESYYEICQPEHLAQLCRDFGDTKGEPAPIPEKKIPLLWLGEKLHKRYLKKNHAASSIIYAEQDQLMDENYAPAPECTAGEPLRKTILAHFKAFDSAAITLNARYQAVIYWRAILPFVTTCFLGIGFYAENVLGIIPIPAPFWTIFAGFGFLIHGLLNLYVYCLSRSDTIKSWHQAFLDNRHVAEILRVLLHFAPFGMELNLHKLCGGNRAVYMTVRHITGQSEPDRLEVTRQSTGRMLLHLEQMLEDQIAYHTRSAARYSGIVKKLEAWNRALFTTGFVIVVLRAFYQFGVVFLPLPDVSIWGIPLSKFAGSFANMLAMMVPGWASYFSSKLALCNFRYNCENHQHMCSRLNIMLNRVRTMRCSVQDVPMEAMNALAEELAEVMLVEDISAWDRQHRTATVKQL